MRFTFDIGVKLGRILRMTKNNQVGGLNIFLWPEPLVHHKRTNHTEDKNQDKQ